MTSKQTESNKKWSKKNNEMGLCRFCKNISLPTQKLCCKCFLKTYSMNSLGDRKYHEELLDILMSQEFKCYLTGRDLTLGIDASIDHILPVSRNPELAKEISNISWCHKDINRIKTDFTPDELINICKEILSFNGIPNQ